MRAQDLLYRLVVKWNSANAKSSLHCVSGGCVYKNTLYQQGQRWSDGCDFTCVCEDGSTGRYRCSPKSVQQSFSLILFSWEGWGNEQRVVMAKQCRVKLCTDRTLSLCRRMNPVNLLLVTVCSQIAYVECCHNLCDKKRRKETV